MHPPYLRLLSLLNSWLRAENGRIFNNSVKRSMEHLFTILNVYISLIHWVPQDWPMESF